jgi:hypothetical protein
MISSSRTGSAEAWQRLMLQWEAAHTNYRAVLEAYAALSNVENYSQEREAAEKRALEELRNIKRKIDELIAASSLRRRPGPDSLRVAILEQPGAQEQVSPDDAPARIRDGTGDKKKPGR